MTTIDDLPTEILEEVFLISKANETRLDPFIHCFRRCQQQPVCATHVCGRWRRVALGMGELWSSFAVVESRWPDWQTAINAAEAWIQRIEGIMPLQICVEASSSAFAEAFLPLLVQNIHRVRFIDIDGLLSFKLWKGLKDKMAPTPTSSNLSSLVALSLKIVSAPSLGEKIAGQLPHLRQLRLQYTFPSGDQSLRFFPLEQLTHFHLQTVPIPLQELVSILKRCGNATQLVFDKVMDVGNFTPIFHKPVTLPKLLSLAISSHNTLTDVLTNFECPALHRLRLWQEEPVVLDGDLCAIFAKFIQSSPQLDQVYTSVGSTLGWKEVLNFLDLPFARGVRNFAFALTRPPYMIDNKPLKVFDPVRCPVPGCAVNHLGWTALSSGHIGEVDFGVATVVQPALWQSTHGPDKS